VDTDDLFQPEVKLQHELEDAAAAARAGDEVSAAQLTELWSKAKRYSS
jgi:hypothetical protein